MSGLNGSTPTALQDQQDVRELLTNHERRFFFERYGTLPDGAFEDHDPARYARIAKLLRERDRDVRVFLATRAEGPSEGAASSLTPFTEIVAGRALGLAGPHRARRRSPRWPVAEDRQGPALQPPDRPGTTRHARGRPDGPREAIIVTTEDEPGDTLKPRLMAAGADLRGCRCSRWARRTSRCRSACPRTPTSCGRRVIERNAALVVIDPLMEFIDGKIDSHKSQPVRQAVAALNQIARENGCAVLVIFHLNKGVSTDPLLRHEGSAAFTQIVRGGLMLGHDPDDPDGEEGRQRVLAVSSSNLAAIAPSLVYEITTATVMGDTGEEISTARDGGDRRVERRRATTCSGAAPTRRSGPPPTRPRSSRGGARQRPTVGRRDDQGGARGSGSPTSSSAAPVATSRSSPRKRVQGGVEVVPPEGAPREGAPPTVE